MAMEITRTLDLKESDYRWINPVIEPPQPKPEPKPFDLDNCIQQLQKIIEPAPFASKRKKGNLKFAWEKANIETILSIEEANFWLTAMLEVAQHSFGYLDKEDIDYLILTLRQSNLDNKLNLRKILFTIGSINKHGSGNTVFPIGVKCCSIILNLYSIYEIVNLLNNLNNINVEELHNLLSTITPKSEINRYAASHPAWSREKALEQFIQQKASKLKYDLRRILQYSLQAYLKYFWLYRDEQEIVETQKSIALFIPNIIDWADYQSDVFRLAKLLPMQDEFQQLVESWKTDKFTHDVNSWVAYSNFVSPQSVVLNLTTPDLSNQQMRRLKLPLATATHILIWLSKTKYSALDYVYDSIVRYTETFPKITGIKKGALKREVKQLISAFGSAKAPEVAPYMLELSLSSPAGQVAKNWLRQHPEHTIPGLIPVALEGGKLSKAAVDILRDLKLKGHEKLILAWLEEEEKEISEKLKEHIFNYVGGGKTAAVQFDKKTTPDWLNNGIASLGRTKKISTPAWLNIGDLPPIYVNDVGLNEEQVLAVLLAIKKSKLSSIHPLLAELKQHAGTESLDNFVVQLFELWRKEDAPSKDKWAMYALGFLGSEVAAIKLAPMIITWRSELKHQRVTWGLDCLKLMGTDTALMQLNGIVQKTRHKNLRQKTLEHLAATAQQRGLTTEELEDRIVPSCGLDDSGKRIFDFGKRQFEFVLGEGMKPQVRDEKGKIRASLPKPNTKDDLDKANNAIAA